MGKKLFSLFATVMCLTCAVSFATAQTPAKAMTNDDVVKMVKAGIQADTIIMTITHSKPSFDTSSDAVIKLSQDGVTGPVLNAMMNASQQAADVRVVAAPMPTDTDSTCPDRAGVYFRDGSEWKPLFQAASAGSQVKSVFGGAKSSVVYMGASAQVVTIALPTFCFREIKPDLGITIVKLEQKKDHRELQTSMYNAFSPGFGNGVKMKDIIQVVSRPLDKDDEVTIVQLKAPLSAGQYLILSQNPIFATMPASVPMSMRLGIGYDFEVK
jgi:hypothetical protein